MTEDRPTIEPESTLRFRLEDEDGFAETVVTGHWRDWELLFTHLRGAAERAKHTGNPFAMRFAVRIGRLIAMPGKTCDDYTGCWIVEDGSRAAMPQDALHFRHKIAALTDQWVLRIAEFYEIAVVPENQWPKATP